MDSLTPGDLPDKIKTFVDHLAQYSNALYSCNPISSLQLMKEAAEAVNTIVVSKKSRRFLELIRRKGVQRPSKTQPKLNDELHESVVYAAGLVAETRDSSRTIMKLLEKGADWRSKSTDCEQFKRNCLHIACQRGLAATVLAFIIYGGAEFSEFCNPRDDIMISPLAYAVISNHTVIVHIIFALYGFENIKLNLTANKDLLMGALTRPDNYNRIPLHYAAMNRNESVFNKLYSNCRESLSIADGDGYTPVFYLAGSWPGSSSIIRGLLNSNKSSDSSEMLAVFNQLDNTGGSLLTWFAQDALSTCLELLLTEGIVSVTPTTFTEQLTNLASKPGLLPLENTFSAGAEVNFCFLLRHATDNLFSSVEVNDLVRKHFLHATTDAVQPHTSKASRRMVELLVGMMENPGQFKRHAQHLLPVWLKQCDIAQGLERSLLMFTDQEVSMPEFHAATAAVKQSFFYVVQSLFTKALRSKFAQPLRKSAGISQHKFFCVCEMYSNRCCYKLQVGDDPTGRIPYEVCPCLARGLKYRTSDTPYGLAPYKWVGAANSEENDDAYLRGLCGKEVFLRILEEDAAADGDGSRRVSSSGSFVSSSSSSSFSPSTDANNDGFTPKRIKSSHSPYKPKPTVQYNRSSNRMAFLYTCGDECMCHYDMCPNMLLFDPPKCFFEIYQPASAVGSVSGMPLYALRTRERIGQGQFVGKIVGQHSTREDIELHLARMPNDIHYIRKTPVPLGGSMLELIDSEEFEVYVNLAQKSNFTRFIRHACSPVANLEVHLMLPRNSYDLRQRQMCLFAVRDIKEGEPLTMDMGDWWLEKAGFECNCGASNCVRDQFVKTKNAASISQDAAL